MLGKPGAVPDGGEAGAGVAVGVGAGVTVSTKGGEALGRKPGAPE